MNLTVIAIFVLISAIPPVVAAVRRTYEVRYIIGLVAIPTALTIVFGLTLPIWVVMWIVAFVKAFRDPGRESRHATKDRQAAFMAKVVAETRRTPPVPGGPVAAPPPAPSPGVGWTRPPISAPDDPVPPPASS